MRNIIAIIIMCLCNQYLQAQANPELEINPQKLREYLQENKPKRFAPQYSIEKMIAGDTARFSHSVVYGNVYRLSMDQMPCLRPDNNLYLYNQPNALIPPINSIESIINMPVTKGKPLVWEKQP